MTDTTATPHGDRPQIEHATEVTVTLQHLRHWIAAHGLEGRRVCTGFRLEELGLGELLPALRSRR